MLNRRGFFAGLAGVVAGATLDPERLLWVPGRKLISIPATRVYSVNDLIEQALRRLKPYPPVSGAQIMAVMRTVDRMLERWSSESVSDLRIMRDMREMGRLMAGDLLRPGRECCAEHTRGRAGRESLWRRRET